MASFVFEFEDDVSIHFCRVDMQNHWKLLTLMIGGNDFCSDICYQTNATLWMNESQERNLIKTLRYLRDNMPR